jgi:GT2 family glycosyltransferase
VLPSSLTISVVTFRPDRELLRRCLSNLETAVRVAREKGVVRSVAVALIDNSEDRDVAEEVIALGRGHFVDADVQVTCLHGHANIGYGTAHNLMLHGTGADYQLVLNPDVELAPDALANAIRWLDTHPEVGVAAPAVTRPDGEPDYLCKRYPAVFDLFLRGFAPGFLRRMFRQRLEHYEMRDWINPASEAPVLGIPVMSGCCLLARRRAIDATGGFDPRFFLYFEDFDWSVRLNKVAQSVYLPSFRAVHHGGGAARKGMKHIALFVRSGVRFYRKHGWRWF